MLRRTLASVLTLAMVACGYTGTTYEPTPVGGAASDAAGAGGPEAGADAAPKTGDDAGTSPDATTAEDTAAPDDVGTPDAALDATVDTSTATGSVDAAPDVEPDTSPVAQDTGLEDTGTPADSGSPGDADGASGALVITGTLTGLAAGDSVVLANEGGNDLTLTANGMFAFSAPETSGSAYAVTVLTQPGNPSQTCTVTNGTGTVSNADVTTVSVACVTRTFTVGGTLGGLATGAIVVLEDNGGNALTLAANGVFKFTTPVASGAAYAVTVHTQPVGQSCSVNAGTGTVSGAAISSVVVTCVVGLSVGGTVSGLAAGDSLALVNNGGSTLFVTSNGPFAFPVGLASGAAYDVTVVANPETPVPETCTVTKPSGTVGTTSVTSVAVACTRSGFTIGGTVTGLPTGGTVVLQDNGGDNLSVNANGTFTFAIPIAAGLPYAVTVLTNPTSPAAATCVVTAGGGTVGTGDVTSVAVACTSNFSVGGTLTGLAGGDTVVLQDNGGNSLSLSTNGPFVFTTLLPAGQAYAVTVSTNPTTPTTEVCSVTAGTGNASANVTTVAVGCSNLITIGGAVSGMSGSITVANGSNTTTVSANGPFSLPGTLSPGSLYDVVITSFPSGEACSLTGGTGVATGPVNVEIACTACASSPTVGGNLFGLPGGATIVLQDNGGDNLSLAANGAFTFATPIAAEFGSFDVTVLTQPTGATCVVYAGQGDVLGAGEQNCADITSVEVDCTGAACPAVCNGGCATGVCIIACDNVSDCQVTSITCPSGIPCDIQCGGISSCQITNMTCDPTEPCQLECTNDSSCDEGTLNCGSGPCTVTCDDYAGLGTLNCNGSSSCTNACL